MTESIVFDKSQQINFDKYIATQQFLNDIFDGIRKRNLRFFVDNVKQLDLMDGYPIFDREKIQFKLRLSHLHKSQIDSFEIYKGDKKLRSYKLQPIILVNNVTHFLYYELVPPRALLRIEDLQLTDS